jgi:hypothetical protein
MCVKYKVSTYQTDQAYADCTEEKGTGSFMRMKAIMQDHVQKNLSVFDRAAETLLQKLHALINDVLKMFQGLLLFFCNDKVIITL